MTPTLLQSSEFDRLLKASTTGSPGTFKWGMLDTMLLDDD
ncbi:predicted protein [Botrytis cinerea T4]|uniref:Uncharacterized protein n=1 Tax=Botryotinia fuckeliana (strain T4) TaxID=999810 RepID=G2XWJ6_BOTF4|nr:predicted protein [Botrytis cinerea T4]